MGLFSRKRKKKTKVNEIKKQEVNRKPFTIDDIKDEDMMVAALVATIDFASEKKTDVRLISIKQIS
ncbi:MAG TPA: hypothetical protein GXZ48_07195 [Acholeplasmataceae bacterium]|jgi:hypothetical protein|nr:hypothetical protein [Acholeplasmataceae bacterium]